MSIELAKTYSPKDFEDRIYREWEEKGYFKGVADKSKKPFTIVIPPPNITGQLHMGHALDNTFQDILIRYKRMNGYAALWLPGTDHASIATEAKVVEAMKAEGLTKDDVGREGFLERAWAWKEQYANRIVNQLKKLGSSCDWDRLRFTLDEGCSKAVQNVFVNLYNKGLIYHSERIINWCPKCKTSISDIEVEHEESQGFFWHIDYPLSDESGSVRIATTRPETLLGDTAIAVHPDDERYKSIVGKMVKLPLTDREIPIVADEYVDMEFGTGVVKITPAHDPNDFEVGRRHDLPIINIMTDEGIINENGYAYKGMERYEARKAVVSDLEKQGFLHMVEPHTHNVGHCQRCGTVVEPRVSLQWFVNMEPLAKPAIDAVKTGELRFVPKRFENTYLNWMENIKDWCISRQLWWGHRIPAYYCQNPDCKHEIISKEAPHTCPKCGGKVVQDEDTLDTWFSSALWPFSTLGWTGEEGEEIAEDFKYFYPTSVLVTAYDIIFFWVARMIFSGIEHTGKLPFKDVFIHGLMRDEQGRKMSKSLGNGIDPLEIIEKYGTDALRLTIVSGNSPGNDINWSETKLTASRNFANKLWNASRYILMNLPEGFKAGALPKELTIEDKWLLTRFNNLAKEVTDNIDSYELGVAVQKIRDFIWEIYCDWYIELTKPRISEGGEKALNAQKVLVYVMQGMLKLLHPFMPFITEEIWQSIDSNAKSIMISDWVKYDESLSFVKQEQEFSKVVELIRAIRVQRNELNVPVSKKVSLFIETDDKDIYNQCAIFFEKLAGISSISFVDGSIEDAEKMAAVVATGARAFIPLGELVDKEKELARLEKELEKAKKDVEFSRSKLNNPNFISKAPKAQVEKEQKKLEIALERLKNIKKSQENYK